MKKRIPAKEFIHEFANWLGSKSLNWSPQQKKMAMVLFCLAFSGLSLCIIIFPSRFPIQRPSPPKNIGKTMDRPRSRTFLSPATFEKIESLSSNDSLLRERPHLLDSIHLIEELYQSQLKKR